MIRNHTQDSDFETLVGHDGKPLRVLKEGHTLRVNMMLRDSLSPVQRAIAIGKERIHDGRGNPLGLHRPGFRFAADASIYDAAQEAYRQATIDRENAWRKDPGGPQDALKTGEFIGPHEGDSTHDQR